jgi:hypothetical protein
MWEIKTTDTFDEWYDALDDDDRANVLAGMLVLHEKGPFLGRPHVDTVNDSKHVNMKELRVQSNGKPLRAFFAFDPERAAILLCAGDKTGKKRFYKEMIPVADDEFAAHLKKIQKR